MNEAATQETSNRWGGFIEMPRNQVVQIAFLGAVLGFAYWLLTLFLRYVILDPLFCADPASGSCVSSLGNASNVASVIVAIIGLLGLIRLSVYRPLLIVIATMVSLWGLGTWVNDVSWYGALIASIVLFALGYVTYSWLVRPRSFPIALIIIVAVVILTRWLPVL